MILTPKGQIDEYTRIGAWADETIIDLFLKDVQSAPDAVAVTDPPNRPDFGMGDAQRLSYREVERAMNRQADALLDAGVKKNDIGIDQLPNVVELVICYLATARIVAIISPLPIQYR